MIDELVKHSSLAEEFFEQGKSEGKSEGISQGMRQMVRMVLEGCFGHLSDDVVAALASVEEPALEELGRHAATDSLEQVRARLGVA